MKWISDEDEARIQEARRLLHESQDGWMLNVHQVRDILTEVLNSIHALAQEQPHPEPRIVELSEAEMRKIYPERYT